MPDAPRERPSDAGLPVDLRQLASAPPSPDFVARTLRGIDSDPDVRFSRVLAAHRVPAPSPEFVARMLAALAANQAHSAADTTFSPSPNRLHRVAAVTVAVAAVLMASLAWWLGRGGLSQSQAPARYAAAMSLAVALGDLSRPTPSGTAHAFLQSVDFVAIDGFELLANQRR